MTLNPHLTDQLLAEMRDSRHAAGCIVPDSIQPLIDRLMAQLPGADPRLLGEICMHTAYATSDLAVLMYRRGVEPERIAADVALVLGEAGARLFRQSAA